MNKAVIYFGATGNEAADQMVMQVLEEYCTVNGYEVVAVISENARPEGMTFPMKFAFVGMAEVEDVDVVVTFMSDMVGDCEETIMDNIIMLGEHGITVETANDDMAGLDCQHFFRQIFLGYFSDIVQAFDTLRKNVCGDDYTSLHNPIVLSSVLPAYGMFHSIQILFL